MRYVRHARRAVGYASRKTGVDFEKYLVWGAIIGVGYIVLKTLGLISSAKEALTETGGAIGRSVYDWFHPDTVGEKINYTVKFPDGSFHTVGSLTVGNDGTFTNKGAPPFYVGDGKVYRLARAKVSFRTPGGVTSNLIAVPV